MFGLMTRREHEEILLDLESELVHETKLNDTLQERIRLGEEYRARLEKENATTRAKNRELVHRVDPCTRSAMKRSQSWKRCWPGGTSGSGSWS